MKNIEVIQEKLSTWWNIIVSLVPNIVLLIVFVSAFSFLSKYLIRIITKILYRIFPGVLLLPLPEILKERFYEWSPMGNDAQPVEAGRPFHHSVALSKVYS
jgi:hypothetical protein